MGNLDLSPPKSRRSKYIEGDLRARRLCAQIIRCALVNLEGTPSSVFLDTPTCLLESWIVCLWNGAFAISLPGRE